MKRTPKIDELAWADCCYLTADWQIVGVKQIRRNTYHVAIYPHKAETYTATNSVDAVKKACRYHQIGTGTPPAPGEIVYDRRDRAFIIISVEHVGGDDLLTVEAEDGARYVLHGVYIMRQPSTLDPRYVIGWRLGEELGWKEWIENTREEIGS